MQVRVPDDRRREGLALEVGQGSLPASPEREALAERVAHMLAVADAAIAKALSASSREFLAQNRQRGGQ